MSSIAENAKRDRTFFRGMYLIALVIGAVVPVAAIITAGVLTDDSLPRYLFNPGGDSSSTMLLMVLTWSAATLVSVLGVSSAAWIVMSTAEKLAIDQSRGYLRSMFLLGFATGGLVPLAALIAVGVSSSYLSRFDLVLLILAWTGMLAVCIAGVCSAVWLVRTAAVKLCGAASGKSVAREYDTTYAHGGAEAR
jgi:hypothetical protein